MKLFIILISLAGLIITTSLAVKEGRNWKGISLFIISLLLLGFTSWSISKTYTEVRDFEKYGAQIETVEVNYRTGDTTYTYMPKRD